MAESAGTKDSNELAHLLKTYVEKLEKLCRLCNINPKRGFSKKNKAMKRIAESLLKVHHEKSDSSDVSTIHDIIKSGTALIENTIEMLEEELDPVQPCSMSVHEPVINIVVIQSQVPELNKHYRELFPGESKQHLNIFELLKEISKMLEVLLGCKKVCSERTDACPSMSDRRHDTPCIDSQSVTASNTHCVDCKSCCELKDSSKWILIEPLEISDDAHEMMYRMNLESGCYECMRTGLRVECFGDVQLEYQTCDWDRVLHDPVMKDYSPCGPLMNVKVISGELKAVYLPHFLCLGGSIDEDKVKVLHVEDSGVSLEKCELTRFHAKLLDNNFSVKGLVVRMGLPVNIQCQTLIYQTGKTPLTLHVYLIPNDDKLKEAISKEESTNMLIKKPKPVKPLLMNTWFTLTPLTKSEIRYQITPESLKLDYITNFFEVFVESPKEDFSLQLKPQENEEVVWDVSIRKGDYKQIASTVDGHTSPRLTGTGSVYHILLECLEELDSEELQKFKSYLPGVLFEEKDKIPISKLEKKYRCNIVSCMIEHYKDTGAVDVTLMVLEKMKQNNLAEQLQKKYTQIQHVPT